MHGSKELERAAEILRTIAHPLRLRILSLLCRGEESVGGISQRLRARPASTSQALQILRRERLVAATRGQGRASYRLDDPTLRELVPAIERTLLAAARASADPDCSPARELPVGPDPDRVA